MIVTQEQPTNVETSLQPASEQSAEGQDYSSAPDDQPK
jgi:hypothetical protein